MKKYSKVFGKTRRSPRTPVISNAMTPTIR
jgi:hypothetical protein